MPTTQVIPSSESELQDIANSLWKSRKVVVITGAGISTNSGIPDFRSEGGLYSLIQEQFDAAVAENEINSNGDSDDCDTALELDRNRPTKRRRLSKDNLEIKPQQSGNGDSIAVAMVEEEIVAEIECAGDTDTSRLSEEDASKAIAPFNHAREIGRREDVIMMDSELQNAPDPSDEPPGGANPGPCTPFKTVPAPLDELTGLTPLPSPFISRPVAPKTNGTAGQLTSSPPSLTHDNSRFPSDSDQSFPHTVSSSPLSSPPHFLLDPYQQPSQRTSGSPSPSSSQASSSSTSISDDSGGSSRSTPVLASQSSYTSFATRNSLPNMKGKDLFDAQIWSCPKQTSVFYTFITSLRQKVREAEPTTTHRFVSILRDSRKLVRCYTQNIDQLEERVGLSTSLELGPGSRYRFSARSGRPSGGARGPLKETEASTLSQSDALEETKQPEDSMSTPIGTQVEAESQSTSVNDGDLLDSSSQARENEIPLSQVSSTTVKAPPNRGVECVCVHGSLAQLRCFVCGRTASWDEESRESDTLAGRQPKCPHCVRATAAREERGKRALGVGKLRPNIVLYGEAHPQDHLIEQVVRHDLSLGPDMLLILGTSLRVHGLKTLVREFAKAVHDRGGKVVFVNFTKPPDSVWSDFIDYWVQWDCDAWVSDIEKRKPALWLPPGSSLPGEEKPKKATKSSRKSGAGEMGKIKDGSTATKSRRSTAAVGRKGRPKKEASSITVSPSSQEEAEILVAAAGSEIAVATDPVEPQGPQPLPSETISPEVVVVVTEVTVEVVTPDKPVTQKEEADSANTIPSSDSPPGQGSDLSQPEEKQVAEPLDSPPLLPPAEPAPAPVSPPEDSSKAAPPSGPRSKTSSSAARPSLFSSSSLALATSSISDKASTLSSSLIMSSPQSHSDIPAAGITSPDSAQPPQPPKKATNPRKATPPSPGLLDDEQNGAYLQWKIRQELKRITGQPPLVLPTFPSTIRTGPMAPPPAKQSKRSRKSAPATLAGSSSRASALDNAVEDRANAVHQEDQDEEMNDATTLPSVTFGPVPVPRPAGADVLESVEPESSISALVKNRKRKRQSWKMVRGVEVLVDLDAEDAEAAKQQEEVRPALPEEPKRRMTLPPLRVSAVTAPPPLAARRRPSSDLALQEGFSSTDRLIAKLNSELGQSSPGLSTNNAVHNIDTAAGFSETDRLIALASRPSTPVLANKNRHFNLPPLQIHNVRNENQAPARQRADSLASATLAQAPSFIAPGPVNRPRPEPIEPRVMASGVGSPAILSPTPRSFPRGNVAQTLAMNAQRMAMPMMHDDDVANPNVHMPANGPRNANVTMAGNAPVHPQAMDMNPMMKNNNTMMPFRNMGTHGNMNYPNMAMMTNNQGTFYYEDPMVRRLRYPPMWLEQSYNQSQFALRNSPAPYQVEGERTGELVGEQHPPAPGKGGFGPHQTPASATMAYGPEDQLRREQEAAMIMSMMGRQHQQTQPPIPQPGQVANDVSLFVDEREFVQGYRPGHAPAQANAQAGY